MWQKAAILDSTALACCDRQEGDKACKSTLEMPNPERNGRGFVVGCITNARF